MNNKQLKNLDAHLIDVKSELVRATQKFKPFHNTHEGYAVLLEEVEELWDEIKIRPENPKKIREEAIQVCAMAMRIIMDCTI